MTVSMVTLGGVYDADRDTYVTAELTLAQMMTLSILCRGFLVADVLKERFDAPRLEVDDIAIHDNVPKQSNNRNLVLRANGTGFISRKL